MTDGNDAMESSFTGAPLRQTVTHCSTMSVRKGLLVMSRN